MESESNNYELAYLLSPTLSEEEANTYSGKLTSLIEECQGSLLQTQIPQKRKLAYEVKKQTQAYFGWIALHIGKQQLAGLEKKVKSEQQVLRFMIVEQELERRRPMLRQIHAPQTPVAITRQVAAPRQRPTTAATSAAGEERLDLEALDKKLEEILGK